MKPQAAPSVNELPEAEMTSILTEVSKSGQSIILNSFKRVPNQEPFEPQMIHSDVH